MAINDNSSYTREDKIHKLADLLKQNESNSDALSALLISLTALNPIEAVDDIIPYLKILIRKYKVRLWVLLIMLHYLLKRNMNLKVAT